MILSIANGFQARIRHSRLSVTSPRIFTIASASASSSSPAADETNKVMPITILSGFLGSGKTTFLQNAVRTSNGKKYGLVVNDMASVNIDAKVIKRQVTDQDTEDNELFKGIDTMELQNGCVCCTLAEDMLASVSRLVSMAETKQIPYDHIIVECSGIAEPRNIRELFQEAEDYGMPLLQKTKLDTLVTVIDATVFLDYFGSNADLSTVPSLAFREEIDTQDHNQIQTGRRKITELLLEQVECADVVLINKIDLLKGSPVEQREQLTVLEKFIQSVNPTAKVSSCERGQISPELILGVAKGKGAADWGVLDDHRQSVTAAKASDCKEHTCTDPTHNHDHSHSHSHSHSHEHEHDSHCATTGCTDPSHDHSHDHHHNDHQSHTHETEEMTTAKKRFGITSFVYARRRPFHPVRLSMLLQGLGKLSIEGLNDLEAHKVEVGVVGGEGGGGRGVSSHAKTLMRSKGFVWMGTSSSAAYFMSHAGQFLELAVLGRWWADIPRKDWPAGSEEEILSDYDVKDPNLSKYGDRRQELVFIGQFADTESRAALEEVLDSCLLTDKELREYEETVNKGDDALRALYFPPQKQ